MGATTRFIMFLAMFLSVCIAAEAQELLPDIITNPDYLADTMVTTQVAPGRIHLRLANATPNIGDGPLYIYGVNPGGGATQQEIMQRVFRSDTTFVDFPAGFFVYHPEHGHIHMEDWAQYRLRSVLKDGGIGPVVAVGDKTSFCLLDSKVYDGTLPNAPETAQFTFCDDVVQGISVGYQDVYSKMLPDQWIDITDLPNGVYWLESEADPDNHVLEKSETNNIARVQVTLNHHDIPPDPERPLWRRILAIMAIVYAFLQRLVLP